MAALEPRMLAAFAVALFAMGALAIAGLLLARELERSRTGRRVGRALERARNTQAEGGAGGIPADGAAGTPSAAPRLAAHWLDTPFGQRVVTDEDRRLIDQCGIPSLKGQQWFLTARIGLALLLPLLGQILVPPSARPVVQAAVLLTLGFMSPKWFLIMRAKERKKQVRRELPLYVDILRLLQGVGLSLDQSLQILGADFKDILRVLGPETEMANRQYSQGRSREHSLQRLATLHDNEHLSNLVSLLVQVDKHGGAVQEPLRQFSERLREWRKYEMKERIGKITVKMTVVMITTLLPALLIITAGPGFIAVIRSLGAVGK
ncbi:MAG: type II secretion system F family protein [Comamonadaceae bacterium]|nr:MAG: type II secretion system F family protein [Comamonadaceae bacterium]